MSKYGNKKVIVNGEKFVSKLEAERYIYLLKKKDEGIVKRIKLQPKFELQPKFSKYGKNYRSITYSPDFEVEYIDGTVIYEDTKGTSTHEGDMKRKMFDYKYSELTLKWISKSVKWGIDGWIDYDELKRLRRKNKKEEKK